MSTMRNDRDVITVDKSVSVLSRKSARRLVLILLIAAFCLIGSILYFQDSDIIYGITSKIMLASAIFFALLILFKSKAGKFTKFMSIFQVFVLFILMYVFTYGLAYGNPTSNLATLRTNSFIKLLCLGGSYNELKFIDIRVDASPSPYVLLSIMMLVFGYSEIATRVAYFLSIWVLGLSLSILFIVKGSHAGKTLIFLPLSSTSAMALYLMDRSMSFGILYLFLYLFSLFFTSNFKKSSHALTTLLLLAASASLADSYNAITVLLLSGILLLFNGFSRDRNAIIISFAMLIISIITISYYGYRLYINYYTEYKPLETILTVIKGILSEGLKIEEVGQSLISRNVDFRYAMFMEISVSLYKALLILYILFFILIIVLKFLKSPLSMRTHLLLVPAFWLLLGVAAQASWYYGTPFFQELGWTFVVFSIPLAGTIFALVNNNDGSDTRRYIMQLEALLVLVGLLTLTLHYVVVQSRSASEVSFADSTPIYYSYSLRLYLYFKEYLDQKPSFDVALSPKFMGGNDIQNLLKSLKQIYSVHGLSLRSASFMNSVDYNLMYADRFASIFVNRAINQNAIHLYVMETHMLG